jgi:hypothetical protein
VLNENIELARLLINLGSSDAPLSKDKEDDGEKAPEG